MIHIVILAVLMVKMNPIVIHDVIMIHAAQVAVVLVEMLFKEAVVLEKDRRIAKPGKHLVATAPCHFYHLIPIRR
jgi:hypothetical protein